MPNDVASHAAERDSGETGPSVGGDGDEGRVARSA